MITYTEVICMLFSHHFSPKQDIYLSVIRNLFTFIQEGALKI